VTTTAGDTTSEVDLLGGSSSFFTGLIFNPVCPSNYFSFWNGDMKKGRTLGRFTVGNEAECYEKCIANCQCNVAVYQIDTKRCYTKYFKNGRNFAPESDDLRKFVPSDNYITMLLREVDGYELVTPFNNLASGAYESGAGGAASTTGIVAGVIGAVIVVAVIAVLLKFKYGNSKQQEIASDFTTTVV